MCNGGAFPYGRIGIVWKGCVCQCVSAQVCMRARESERPFENVCHIKFELRCMHCSSLTL